MGRVGTARVAAEVLRDERGERLRELHLVRWDRGRRSHVDAVERIPVQNRAVWQETPPVPLQDLGQTLGGVGRLELEARLAGPGLGL